MPLDSNGIWQYTEVETAAPVSTMLNRLAGSVSTVVGPLVIDTGWQTIANASGSVVSSGFPCQVRRKGDWVYAWGRWTRTTNIATQVWGSLPAGVSGLVFPPRIVEVGDYFGQMTRVYITSSGEITSTGTPTTGTITLSFQAMWPAI